MVEATGAATLDAPVALLPADIPFETLKSVLPSLHHNGGDDEGEGEAEDAVQSNEFVLGRNVHGTCLEITEPALDDAVTGDRDAYMAGVLAKYRKTLVEKTKYHLGERLRCRALDQ